MKKRPWHFWAFILFLAFIYIMGIYDMPMMLSHNSSYYVSHGYGAMAVDYFTDYPIYLFVLWFVNLAAGFLAPLVLLFNARCAKYLALISAMADTALLLLTFLFRNRLAVLGSGVALFDIFILLITFAFYFYCKRTESKVNVKKC